MEIIDNNKTVVELKENKSIYRKDDNSLYIALFLYLDKKELSLNSLNAILNMEYEKNMLYLGFYIIGCNDDKNDLDIFYNFRGKHIDDYADISIYNYIEMKDGYDVPSYEIYIKSGASYYIYWDSLNVIENSLTLTHLRKSLDCSEGDVKIVAPMMKLKDKYWSNFWGQIDAEGFYKRSDNYIDIVELKEKGIFEVPFVRGIYLTNKETINKFISVDVHSPKDETKSYYDKDMIFCENMRNNFFKMYVNNEIEYGYISEVPNEDVNVNLYDYGPEQDSNINKKWLNKYIDKKFIDALENNTFDDILKEVTTDVYMFPFVTKDFCDDIVSAANNSSRWTGGVSSNNAYNDKRVGGYENHPTDDIHLNQLGLNYTWEHIVNELVSKIARHCYMMYTTKNINISFIVRYTNEYQKELRPHHDSSTYTINIALNDEYEGGGCEFLRQNYKHTCVNVGYATIHPGKLTHYHKGLPITSGTRYILVSFIN